jgi:hypothetical protein
MGWYKTGSITVTKNSKTVTGSGTAWANASQGVGAGQMLLLPAAGTVVMYEIASVQSNTQLTLADAYSGTTATGQTYAIVTTYIDSVPDFARRLATQLTYYQSQLDGWQKILTGTGNVTLTAPDGTTVTINTIPTFMAGALSRTTTAEQTVASSVKFNNGITSLGENVMQAKTAGANVITRYKDMDGVEKGAIFVTSATGQMTQRWGGTDFSAIYSADGRVTFPSDIYIGSLKVATQSTSLGTLDLNTVKTEGDYYQAVNTNATEDNHYPSGQAGVLRVLNSRAGVSGQVYITQLFYPYKANDFYYQRSHDAGTTTWSDWDVFYGRNKNDSRYLQTGSYGLGVVNNSGTFDFTKLSVATGFYRGIEGQNGAPPGISSLAGTSVSVSGGYIGHVYAGHGVTPGTIKLYTGWTRPDGTVTFVTGWHSGNTTVDANGFIKKASPIVKLFGTGESELNDESQGVTTERVSEGVYSVSGTLGFNSDGAWGGAKGGIGLPKDVNDLPLVWVDYEVDEFGDLLIKTFHRLNSTAPKFAQNVKVGYKEGQPIDIPAGRWIDLRVEMPAVDEPEYIPEPEPEVTPDPIPAEELPQEPEGGEELAHGETPAPLVEPKE